MKGTYFFLTRVCLLRERERENEILEKEIEKAFEHFSKVSINQTKKNDKNEFI